LAQPKILILDDCLSAVDAVTEAAVLGNLRGFLAARTSVVISHRLVAVRQADHIIVLEHGCVIESGDEAQLLAAGGLCARLHTLQNHKGAQT
jgi:ATP-binding cassette, subfamily B, multidrug efflux pump